MTLSTDTELLPGQQETAAADYDTVRSGSACYQPAGVLVRVTGADRLDYLDTVLSKSTEFVEPDQVREVLLLTDDAEPFAVVTHWELEDETWLLTQTPVAVADVEAFFAQAADGVEIDVAPAGWGVVAVEGPASWKVAAHYLDFDISGLILHQSAPAEVDGVDGTHYIARVGTTGEYGYVLLSDTFEQVRAHVLATTEGEGGRQVSATGLSRVQAEAGNPFYAAGFAGLDVSAADLAWLVDWQRIGEFRGSDALAAPTRDDRKITPVVVSNDAALEPGAEVRAGDTVVGSVAFEAPAGNPAERLAFVVVDAPFWVSGTELQAGDAELQTVSIPRVVSRSTTERMG
ncbi:hypothetical protein [Flexivirga meconopsidis]|uniref:hypothetical protein n=1 Tax=Flexivirga meconopsidis TaxID=2977121 RepID=UPI00224058D7|nr:hypothetical protein [Flexivirga meconopsidis]